MKRTPPLLLAAAVLVATALAQNEPSTTERAFHQSQSQLRVALRQLNAYKEYPLPLLDGFVADGTPDVDRYSRAYYQFQVVLKDAAPGQVLMKTVARITAWYTAPDESQSEYRLVASNGRLERDLLDRLDEYLAKKGDADSVNSTILEDELVHLRSQREQTTSERDHLQAEIAEMEGALQSSSALASSFVLPKQAGFAVYSLPTVRAKQLLVAQADDEFHVLEKRGAWIQVQLEPNSTGWVQASQFRSIVTTAEPGTLAGVLGEQESSPYSVDRDAVLPFLGDWKELQGKKALFVWLSQGPLLEQPPAARQKLGFAMRTLSERYRQNAHSPGGVSFDGIVLVFPGTDGGVIAATTQTLQRWIQGSLSETEFLARCSIDPAKAFQRQSNRK